MKIKLKTRESIVGDKIRERLWGKRTIIRHNKPYNVHAAKSANTDLSSSATPLNSTSDANILDKYRGCILLHAIGDTIGYMNGEFEFQLDIFKSKPNVTLGSVALEKLYKFISYGGINQIDMSEKLVSDDTILHVVMANALLENYSTMDQLGENLRKLFIEIKPVLLETAIDPDGTEYSLRLPGKSTIHAIDWLERDGEWDKLSYNFYMGGSGVSMRSPCIGLAYYGPENRYLLMQVAIECGRMTHNSVIGYLGGWVSALFTAFAVEKIPPKEWSKMMVGMLLNGDVEQYIKKSGRGYADYNKDVHIFIDKWSRFNETKFDKDGEVVFRNTTWNIRWRSEHYATHYSRDYDDINLSVLADIFIGSGGDDSCIIAYDALLDARDNWEMLVVYAMLHAGDTDTTGSIAAAWYGVLYGTQHVPKHFFDALEYRKDLEDVAQLLAEKYGKTPGAALKIENKKEKKVNM